MTEQEVRELVKSEVEKNLRIISGQDAALAVRILTANGKRPSMDAILRASAQRCGATCEEVLGPSRLAYISRARHIAWHLARKLRGDSWASIGKFSGRDHSSTMYGAEKIRLQMGHDEGVREDVLAIIEALGVGKA
jgi:chromosomal replication initiation ATPase DnaA